ncbi:MAG: AAA family ATPase, partial [Pseudomonadota bacterium]
MRATLVASSKGGCGKTTAAVTMAAALAERGYRVALADADPQRAGLAWLARRPDAAQRIAALDWTRPLDIGAWPESVRPNGIDWLVIDAACAYGSGAYGGGALDGGLAPLERLLERADTVVTPVGPSFFDGHAALGFLRRIENTRPVRRGQAEIVVLANRIPARRAAANALRPFLSQAALELSAAVTERAAYSRLAAQGLAV